MEDLCDDYVFGQNLRGVHQHDQQGKTKFQVPQVINFDELQKKTFAMPFKFHGYFIYSNRIYNKVSIRNKSWNTTNNTDNTKEHMIEA